MLEHPTYKQCSKKAKRVEQPRPHALTSRVRPEAMLCLVRQMLSLAYSPQARRPLDLRPKQRCVQGAEDPPIKRHSSIANHAGGQLTHKSPSPSPGVGKQRERESRRSGSRGHCAR